MGGEKKSTALPEGRVGRRRLDRVFKDALITGSFFDAEKSNDLAPGTPKMEQRKENGRR